MPELLQHYVAAHGDARSDEVAVVLGEASLTYGELEEGSTRKLEWPENAFFRARIPGTNRDAVILIGVEPNYRWRTFAELVTDLDRTVQRAVSQRFGVHFRAQTQADGRALLRV